MVFGSVVVPEDWRPPVIISQYKGKGERTKCRSYKGISLSCCFSY